MLNLIGNLQYVSLYSPSVHTSGRHCRNYVIHNNGIRRALCRNSELRNNNVTMLLHVLLLIYATVNC